MKYKNAKENPNGSIDCLVLVGNEWVPHTQDPAFEYKPIEDLGADDWPEVKPCDKAEKDAHKAAQARASVVAQLSTLDLPLYTIERALAGDIKAQKKIAHNEIEKQKLRELLK